MQFFFQICHLTSQNNFGWKSPSVVLAMSFGDFLRYYLIRVWPLIKKHNIFVKNCKTSAKSYQHISLHFCNQP